ncbi:zinc ribbon domain-containing protein [Ornithinibacillus contaminans]|uniref:zinc ribbon domain-containing protein n=1 Tax=Ornithinibacillus contaminans TaxID=694055 RepID=UPI001F3905E7|nr:zinc ribbon domain-containing protein [Ornithinibacillus contaminans]
MHCPYCGSIIKEEEAYCVSCGKALPSDINERHVDKKHFDKLWYMPIVTIIIVLLVASLFQSYLQKQTTQAKELYELGEQHLAVEDYEAAKEYFTKALQEKPSFKQGQTALEFIEKSYNVTDLIEKSRTELKENNFQAALSLLDDAETSLQNFNGSATTTLVDHIVSQRNTVKTEQLKSILADNPSIDELKGLLWEADAINTSEASEMKESIRSQIIDFAYSKASEQLSNKQFSDAQLIVDDGLKYAPESEKLLSLKTTIEKEKVSFEITQQQRIQQAINTAQEEREMNETDAIEVVSIKVENDDQGNLVVKGEVKSVATIPINSVLVEYSLLTNETEFLSNNVYVYPDTLYPNETGKFEFTHYDIDKDFKTIDVNTKKITWYTNY